MTRLIPFPALRPREELASRIASVPYDVVDTEEARKLAEGNPLSFLRVVRSEIELPPGTDPYSDAVYERADSNFKSLIQRGHLIRDPDDALYLYRQVMGSHSQTGLVACCPVDEYDQNLIKKHERTRPDKENDRTRHVLSIRANAGPVFLTYRPQEAIDGMVRAAVERDEPLYDFTAPDQVRHTVWKIKDTAMWIGEFARVPATYVADGHHRSASASRARAELAKNNPNHTGRENYNRFLAVLFPANQLRILPYNRVVHDLNGLGAGEFLEQVSERLVPLGQSPPRPAARGCFSIYVDGRWHGFRARDEHLEDSDPVARLDAAILQEQVLGPILGIGDPRTSDRISFVGGIRGIADLENRVESRGEGAAFSLHPLGIDQLMEVADQDRVLPPKSTWFEPKLRSGLLIHTF